METQKIVNLLNSFINESSKYATQKCVIDDENNTQYGEGNENYSSIKLKTKVIKSSSYDYSNAYILLTGEIIVTGGDENADIAFKNRPSFTRCVTEINDKHIDTAGNLDIILHMYNLIEYSDNYSDTSGSLWQFKNVKNLV